MAEVETVKPLEVNISRPNSAGSPLNCAICLNSLTDKCSADSCMHEFCFSCLLKWSKIKPECPLCKQQFKTIKHNCKPNGEFEVYVVKPVEEASDNLVDDIRFLETLDSRFYLPTPPPAHEFMFRTTFTVEAGENGIQQMLLSHPLNTISITGFQTPRITHRLRRDTSATSFRRSIYNQNLWVYAPPDISGRYRDVTPAFYRQNPAARTRLAPWLNRELNALLYENTRQVMRLVDIIMELLLEHHICSRTFRLQLRQFLGTKTDHFVHEFYNFMRSPYDMIGYDRNISYNERPRSPTPYIDVSDADSSSDVIVIGSDHESSRNNNSTNNNNNNVVDVIDLVASDSDEPIIVSEEPAPAQASSSTSRSRVPKLPIKLEIKRMRRCRSRKSHHRRKRRRRCNSSNCRCRSSSSTSSSSSTISVGSNDSHRRHKQKRKKLIKYIEKWRKKLDIPNRSAPGPETPASTSRSASSSSSSSNSTSTSTSTSTSSTSTSTSSSSSSTSANSKSDSDSDAPLANYAKSQKKRKRYQHKKIDRRRRSHTITRPDSTSRSSVVRESQPSTSTQIESHTPPLTPLQLSGSYMYPSPLNLCTRKDTSLDLTMFSNTSTRGGSPVSLLTEHLTNQDGSEDGTDSDTTYHNPQLRRLHQLCSKQKLEKEFGVIKHTNGFPEAGPSSAVNREVVSETPSEYNLRLDEFLEMNVLNRVDGVGACRLQDSYDGWLRKQNMLHPTQVKAEEIPKVEVGESDGTTSTFKLEDIWQSYNSDSSS